MVEVPPPSFDNRLLARTSGQEVGDLSSRKVRQTTFSCLLGGDKQDWGLLQKAGNNSIASCAVSLSEGGCGSCASCLTERSWCAVDVLRVHLPGGALRGPTRGNTYSVNPKQL